VGRASAKPVEQQAAKVMVSDGDAQTPAASAASIAAELQVVQADDRQAVAGGRHAASIYAAARASATPLAPL
jgi:hypothetical protein